MQQKPQKHIVQNSNNKCSTNKYTYTHTHTHTNKLNERRTASRTNELKKKLYIFIMIRATLQLLRASQQGDRVPPTRPSLNNWNINRMIVRFFHFSNYLRSIFSVIAHIVWFRFVFFIVSLFFSIIFVFVCMWSAFA